MRKFLPIIIFSFLSSCSLFKPKEQPQPELPPPPNYYPTFIKSPQPLVPNVDKELKLEISRFRIIDDESVELFFHLINKSYFFATGATAQAILHRWCGGEIITAETTIPISKLTIKEVVQTKREPYAIAFVLDHSGSMGDERAYEIQEATASYLRKKDPNDIVTVVKYDHTTEVEVPPTQSSNYALSLLKINGLEEFGGWTAINDAIMVAINQLSTIDPKYTRIIIVFTDGWENSSKSTPEEVVRIAKDNNVIICGIDYGYNINPGFMKNYAHSTSGIYKHIFRKEEFDMVFEDILKRFEYYYSTIIKLPEFGYHKIVLKYCLDKATFTDSIEIDNTPEIGDKTLLNVYFDFDKYTLKQESYAAIKRVAKLMRAYPTIVIEIAGHTDSINRSSDPNYNIKLSQQRADEVKKALIKEGIDQSRIVSRGYGETRPIADNSTPEGRARNRRTEFIIIKK